MGWFNWDNDSFRFCVCAVPLAAFLVGWCWFMVRMTRHCVPVPGKPDEKPVPRIDRKDDDDWRQDVMSNVAGMSSMM